MLIEQEKLEAVKAAGFASASEAQEMYNKALEDGTLTEAKKKKLQEAGLLAQFESATAQDKMNAAMDKFSDLFIQIVDPLNAYYRCFNGCFRSYICYSISYIKISR